MTATPRRDGLWDLIIYLPRSGQILVTEGFRTLAGKFKRTARLTFVGCRLLALFFLAYSSERIGYGNKKYTVENSLKVVGGVTLNYLTENAELQCPLHPVGRGDQQ